MTDNILPSIDFAAVIAEILEDYLPEDSVMHTLTNTQVNNLFDDLVAGCEEAYEDASEKAEEAIERAHLQDASVDPFGLPESDEEPVSEESFCTTEVLQEAISGMKSAGVVVEENEAPIRYIYR